MRKYVVGKQMTFVLVHGAFQGAWTWHRVVPYIREVGYLVVTPTLAGLGDRSNTLDKTVSLDTHVNEVADLFKSEDLWDVILVGHSYGGLVITGVMESVPERLSQIVYLDAFIPEDGQSFFSLVGPDIENHIREMARVHGEGWRVPPVWTAESLGVSDPEHSLWVDSRTTPQSLRTFNQPLRLSPNQTIRVPRSYIHCSGEPTGRFFLPFAERARADGWRCAELTTAHLPMITMPQQLADLLSEFGRTHD
jgi:pimeloyl-ACP methyl ester carboxylesterase